MAEARAGLEHEYEERLELIRAEAAGRTAALRTRLTEATKRAEATAAALGSARAELASSRSELLLLQLRVDDAEAVMERNADEIRQRQTLEHMHGPMLRMLRERANTALGNICEAAAEEPHVTNYVGNLQFFTDVVMHLENCSERSRQLVEERSRGLLAQAFSRVFNHLQNFDPLFDFDAAIAPVPEAVRGDLARWVEDNVDALVRAFTSNDDGVIIAADEGVVVNGGGDGANNGDEEAGGDEGGASDASRDTLGDAASDLSD